MYGFYDLLLLKIIEIENVPKLKNNFLFKSINKLLIFKLPTPFFNATD